MNFMRKHIYNCRSGGKYDLLNNRIFCKGHTCVMHVTKREREKVVSISRTANDRQGRVSGKNVLLALACSQEVHKYGFFFTSYLVKL